MKLTLIHKNTEAGNAVSYRFKPTDKFVWEAGQYMRFTVKYAEQPLDHWFTIASAPYEKEIMVTTRTSGSEYKQALNRLDIGDKIEATGLTGDFVWQETEQPKVFVAAGVGITPFRSIIRERHHQGLPIEATLLYANPDDNVIFQAELDQINAAHPEFNIAYFVDERVTPGSVLERLPNPDDSLVYIAGPEIMVDTLSRELQETGIGSHLLRRDAYTGYNLEA
jgi:ferredoxin-NADP reductase